MKLKKVWDINGYARVRRAARDHECGVVKEYPYCYHKIEKGEEYIELIIFPNELTNQTKKPLRQKSCFPCTDIFF